MTSLTHEMSTYELLFTAHYIELPVEKVYWNFIFIQSHY